MMEPSGLNSLRILSSSTGKEVETDRLDAGMSPAGFCEGYYLFTCTFAVKDVIATAGSYDIVGLLRDSSLEPAQASFSLPLSVDGKPTPRLEIGRGEARQTTAWALAGDEILVEAKFPLKMYPRSPKAELTVQDLDGAVYLRCDPFTASFCEFIYQDEKETQLLVDLSAGACKAWRPGNNTYIITLDGLKGGYGQACLCRPLKINAMPYAVDLLIGGDPIVDHTPQGVPVLSLLQGAGRLQVPTHLKTSSLTDDRCYQDGAMGDLDGDGITDVAAIMSDFEKSRYLDNHFLLICQSSANFQPCVIDSLGSSLFGSSSKDVPRPSVEVADLDGDGDNDIATQVGRTISVFWNDGTWKREKVLTLPSGRIPCEMHAISVGDLDGDDRNESGLAIAHDRGITITYQVAGKWTERNWLPDMSGYAVRDICIKPGAYQGMDLVIALTDWEVFAGYFRADVASGLVMPCPAYSFEEALDAREVEAGDMDGDGRMEMVVLSLELSGSALTYLDNNADGYYAAATITSDTATRIAALEIADVQEDGRAELMVGGVDGRVQMLGGSGPAALWFKAGNMHLLQATGCAIRFLCAA
jgi:hypothetical protein